MCHPTPHRNVLPTKEERERERERERESYIIYHHKRGREEREVTSAIFPRDRKRSYLSPDLALKERVDLLVLAFFVESKPLQPNGDG